MTQFVFSWENISYTVVEKTKTFWNTINKRKTILDGVSGVATSNNLIAIMGSSGCGKTTLLSILSGQKIGKTGLLKLNDKIITEKTMRTNSEYMQQNDLFLETFTVYEHLKFVAAMSLKATKNERVLAINRLLRTLGLEGQKYMRIEHLSGGEKRKLSLAAKLLPDPYFLFCDEPISGLDSFNAISIVRLLETIASSGKIVFMTVHQPSSQLFDLFDNIILLSANGGLVFQGTKDNAKLFFESQGLVCPGSFNPADFYIKSLAIRVPGDERRIELLREAYRTEYAVKYDFAGKGYNGLLLKHKQHKQNFFLELGWLIWRTLIDMKGNIGIHMNTFLLIMLTACIIGMSYTYVSIGKTGSIQSIQGALLLIVSELVFDQMYYVIYTFPKEVQIFTQEKNLYSPFPYFLSKLLSLVPFCLLNTLGFLGIYFIFLPFLNGFQLFLDIFLILVITSIGGSALGLCLSALFPSIDTINLISVPFELLCLTLSGMWIRLDTLPKFFSIVKYFSPFYMSYESVCIAFWGKITKIENCTAAEELPCFENGAQILENYDFASSSEEIQTNLIYLLILIAVYCYIGYIGIIRKRALYTV
ncbi:protein brown-like [Cylas formicarius]|uniref:protein brown-like n=1 Tax=Cylas formicarius TaxID=197179 RepID=UPI002958687F|nr:protein brown-like [Cylas formicarius]